jgi:hypothetical protein
VVSVLPSHFSSCKRFFSQSYLRFASHADAVSARDALNIAQGVEATQTKLGNNNAVTSRPITLIALKWNHHKDKGHDNGGHVYACVAARQMRLMNN